MKPTIAISNIPEQFRPFFIKLSELKNEQFEEIKGALANAPFSAQIRPLSDAVSPQVPSISSPEIYGILSAVASLFSVLERFEISTETLSDSIKGLVLASEPTLTPEQGQTFSSRLGALLKSDRLCLAAKAIGLSVENNSSYLSARIVTDMRPLFDLSAESEPQAALIVHSLHLHALSGGGDEQDIFITLDSDDIQDLISLLRRAEQKEKFLTSLMERAQITALDLSTE
jgi:hypothetical protein